MLCGKFANVRPTHLLPVIKFYNTLLIAYFMNALIETRNRHFLEACERMIRLLPPHEEINLARLAYLASTSPAPHYYCTFTYAMRMLRVLRHGRMPIRRDRRRTMWEEINAKCDHYMERRGCNLPQALAYVLATERASQFFIAATTAHRLVQKLWSVRNNIRV